jgi:hypothetical protein
MGPFDRMFDRDGDGELDAFERASQMDFIDYMNGYGIYKEDDSDDFCPLSYKELILNDFK